MGIACYVLLAMLIHAVVKIMGFLHSMEERTFRILAQLWPRKRAERASFYVAVCVLNPITEEMMFRGILIHQVGYLYGSIASALIIGLAVDLGLHLYQGCWALFTHIPFFILTILILYSPFGIVGAIGLHTAADLWPILSMKHSLGRYRLRRRQLEPLAEV